MKKRQRSVGYTIIFGLFIMLVLVPILTLVIWVFTERWAWPDLMPQVFSLRAITGITGRSGQLFKVFGSSILISSIVGVLSVSIGIMTSRALLCYEFVGKRWIYFFTILPFMVPATVFAMGIQMTFIKLGLNNTVTGVIIAHLICSLPYAVRLLMDGMKAAGIKLEEQARVLGASGGSAFVKVTLPLLVPVIISAMCMAYIVSFSQYFLTLLIGGGKVSTFTIVMVPYLQSGERNVACIYSVIFLIITMAVFAVFEKIMAKGNAYSGGFYG